MADLNKYVEIITLNVSRALKRRYIKLDIRKKTPNISCLGEIHCKHRNTNSLKVKE